MKNSGTFLRLIVPADANNIVLLADFNQILAVYKEFEIENIVEHAIVLEDLQAKVGLFSLLEAGWPDTNALASESSQEAALAKIKKEGQKIYLGIYHAYGNGPWIKKGEEILQNKNSLEQPWALMAPFFSTNETALIDEDLKIGVKIEPKAQGNGGLKGSDYLTIFGSWRKVTNIRKKKDEGIEALAARIESLELALAGRLTNLPANTLLGRNTSSGIVETIPQTTFAKPADIDTAIFNLIGGAPGVLNTLDELAAALGDNASFAGNITNLLATKAPLANPIFNGFTTLGDNAAVKVRILTFTSPSVSSNTQLLTGQLPPMDKIVSLSGWLKCADTDYYPPSFFSASKLYTNWWSIYSWSGHLYFNLHPDAIPKMGNQPGRIIITYIE